MPENLELDQLAITAARLLETAVGKRLPAVLYTRSGLVLRFNLPVIAPATTHVLCSEDYEGILVWYYFY